jgi:hypothetical protein
LDGNNYKDYNGICSPFTDTLVIEFGDNWMLNMNYTLVNKLYQLDAISFEYNVDSKLFPNASNGELGKHMVYAKDLGLYSTLKGNSYKCDAATAVKFDSNKVTMTIMNYQGQPFMEESKVFGTGINLNEITNIRYINGLF